ncbi:hypothetical protein TWF730_000397 [Orbilia blumenaviensis]|uniref:Uncharacterized protein n=1 Tax=Orbilia blumenaviensis TaxID=1796055 RepID=A0AAV9VMQ3_9PEZI
MLGPTKLVVVTDSLKGAGYRIVCAMLQNTRQPLTIYMTGSSSRHDDLNVQFQHDPATMEALKKSGSIIKTARVDLDFSGSIKAFRDHLQDTYGASHGAKPLSVLINAPAARSGNAQVSAGRMYFGSKNLTRLLLPIMKRTGDSRIVNVSVDGGQAGYWIPSRELVDSFKLRNLTEKRLDNLMQKFQTDGSNGKLVEAGWSRPSKSLKRDTAPYVIPKIALAAYTFILAKENPGFLINASGGDSWRLANPVYSGALTPTFLALGDLEGRTGGFWIGGKRVDWDTGKPIES